ncbi:MAG: hypothetical protein WCG92_11325 [Hyphomicrobiales bacterium]
MAGYSPDDGNACRLTGTNRVKQRVAEIQAGAVQSTQVTIASLLAAADEIRGLAVRDKQYSAAVGAVKEMGILSGVRIDRREVGSPGEFDRLSDEELMQLVEGKVELVELPGDDVGRQRPSARERAVLGDRAPARTAPVEADVPSASAESTPAVTLEDHLSAFGLTAGMEDGVVVVKSANGLRCEYSARYFVPVAFPGLEHAGISARLIEPGHGEVRIAGQCYTVTSTVMMGIDLEAQPPLAAGPDCSGDREADRRVGKQRRTKL